MMINNKDVKFVEHNTDRLLMSEALQGNIPDLEQDMQSERLIVLLHRHELEPFVGILYGIKIDDVEPGKIMLEIRSSLSDGTSLLKFTKFSSEFEQVLFSKIEIIIKEHVENGDNVLEYTPLTPATAFQVDSVMITDIDNERKLCTLSLNMSPNGYLIVEKKSNETQRMCL